MNTTTATVEVSAISVTIDPHMKKPIEDQLDYIDCCLSSRSSSNTSLQLSTSPSFCNAYTSRRRSSLRSPFRSSSFSTEESIFDHNLTTLSSSVGSEYSISHPLDDEDRFELFGDDDNEDGDHTKKQTNNTQLIQSKDQHNISTPLEKPQISDSFLNLTKLVGLFKDIRDTTVKNHTFQTFHTENSQKKLVIEVPLETFNNGFKENGFVFDEMLDFKPNLLTLTLNGKSRRLREERVNPNYLKHYSIVQSMQNNYVSNISEDELDIFDQFLIDNYNLVTNNNKDSSYFERALLNKLSTCWRLQNKFDCSCQQRALSMEYLIELKFMSLARHKLWTTMTLAPRGDELPSINSIFDDIIPQKPIKMIKNFDSPWMSINDIPNRRKLAGVGINGNGFTQYISKDGKSRRYSSLLAS